MPLGPRPEPPRIPKKEPNRPLSESDYDVSNSLNPPLPPKTPLYSAPLSSIHQIQLNSSHSYHNSITQMSTSPNSRLKGPRPLSSPSGPPKKPVTILPYPIVEAPMPSASILDESIMLTDVTGSPSESPGKNFIPSMMAMPEPDAAPISPTRSTIPFSPAGSLSRSRDISLEDSASLANSWDNGYSRSGFMQAVPMLVPPPPHVEEKRPTKSIFQWGIPVELLPPMPVPVDSMNGLTVGDSGQYTMNLDLPQIPPLEPVRPRFSVEQLTVHDFQQPEHVWALSCLADWIYYLVANYNAEFVIDDVHQGLIRLFMYRFDLLTWGKAETMARAAVASLKLQQFIVGNSDLLVIKTIGPPITGVLTELTANFGCYSFSSHEAPIHTGCYSSQCIIESQFIQLQEAELKKQAFTSSNLDSILEFMEPTTVIEMNWRKFWHLEEGNVASLDPKLVKLQFAIHELIMSEVSYLRDLNTYIDVYGEIELLQGLSVMDKQEQFCSRVFDRIRAVIKSNTVLLSAFVDRQSTQGPFLNGIGDLITLWAKDESTLEAYSNYAGDYLWADFHLRRELTHNSRLQKWMEERAKDPRMAGRPHSFFFNRIIPRVARYHLLLGSCLKYTPDSLENEQIHINEAIKASNILTQLCDDQIDKQKSILDVQNLKAHIVFKSSSVTADLKLGDKRRKLIRRGDMLRRGDLKMDWVETHSLLLDNFLVLSKTREGMNGTAFYVTKAPIPLDLLVLESSSDESVKKVSNKLTLTRHGPAIDTSTPQADGENSSVLFPLRLTHLGRGGSKYLLFVPNKPERDNWIKSIIEAKQSRAQLAFARSAEPFRLSQITDQFAYPESEKPNLPVPVPDTPVYRAVKAMGPDRVSKIVQCRKINCSVCVGTALLIGTDSGLWFGGNEGVFPWARVLELPQHVTQLEILDSMNAVFVKCSDNNLTWYPLDQLVARGLGESRKVRGTRLNQYRKVLDFKVTFYRGRVVVMYLQPGGILKIIEPVRSYGAEATGILQEIGVAPSSHCIDYFRELERLLISTDTTKITPFFKSIILTTSKNFEWVTENSAKSIKIPSGNAISKEMQHWGRPVKIIKLDAVRLLLCYEACYIICDYKGNMGIQPTTWFLDKCYDCAFYSPYLILFSQGGDMIEIRYVEEFPGRLVQLISGKDIRLLSSSDESVYFRMAHPWNSERQLMLQLIGNEVVRDTGSTWQSSSV